MSTVHALTGSSYAKRLFRLMALAILWLIAFPFVAYGAAMATGCSRVGGACGAVGLIAGLTLLPLGFLVIFGLMAMTVGRRLSTLDAPRWWAFLLFVLLIGDLGKLATLGGGWAVAFVLGLMGLTIPWRLIAAISTLVFLGRYPDGAFLTDPTPTKKTAFAAFLFLSLTALAGMVLLALLAGVGMVNAKLLLGDLVRSKGPAIVLAAIGGLCLLSEPVACITLMVCYKKILRQARDASPPGDLGAPPAYTPPPRPQYPPPYPQGGGQAVTFGRRGVR